MIFPKINEIACPLPFYNETVFFTYICPGGELELIAIPPEWITFDEANHRLVGAQNTYTGGTAEEANQAAQKALDDWAHARLQDGGLTCVTVTVYGNIYGDLY